LLKPSHCSDFLNKYSMPIVNPNDNLSFISLLDEDSGIGSGIIFGYLAFWSCLILKSIKGEKFINMFLLINVEKLKPDVKDIPK